MSRFRISLGLTCLLLGALPVVGADSESVPADYIGCWVGRIVVGREASEVRIGISSVPEGTSASLWIPEISAGPIPVGAVTVERGQIRFGPLTLELDGESLQGLLPDSMDPGDSLDARFRRSHWLQADCETIRRLELVTVWQASLPGGVWANALMDEDNGQVVVGTLDGHLLAIDAESGASRWSTALAGSIRSAPVIWNGNLYVASDDGLVLAVGRRDGRVIRKYRVANALSPAFRSAPGKDFQFRGHQLLAREEGLLVGTLDGAFHRIDAEGKISAFGEPLGTSIVALAGAGDGLFAASQGGEVYRIDAEGRAIWRTELAGSIHGDLLFAESSLYVGDRGYYLWSLDPDSGATHWKKKFFFSWIESAPLLSDGVLFVGSSDSKRTRAIDPASGALLWSSATKGWPWAHPVIIEGLVVQGEASQKGYLTELRPGLTFFDSVTGNKIHELETEPAKKGVSGYVVSPLISGDLLIAFDTSGRVTAWRLSSTN